SLTRAPTVVAFCMAFSPPSGAAVAVGAPIGVARRPRNTCIAMATEDDVRELALALPATTERLSYGTPGFRVKDRLFARIREPDVLVLFVGGLDEKEFLLGADPGKFFTVP